MTYFTDRIKNERLNKQITQKEAAEYLHMSESTLSRYESGRITPNAEIIKQFSEYYEIPMHELMDEKELTVKTDPPAETMQENIIDAFFESKHGQQIFYMIIMAISVLTIRTGFGIGFAIYGLYYAWKHKFSKMIILLTCIYVFWLLANIIFFYTGIQLLPYKIWVTDL